MTKYSGSEVIKMVAIMIRTGASEHVVMDYIESMLKSKQITTRLYELLIGMVIDNY